MVRKLSSWVSGLFSSQADLIWRSHAVSHEGCHRKLNEDSYLNQPDRQLWLIADGMGGHDAGEVASQHIVDRLSEIGSVPRLSALSASVMASLQSSNHALREKAATIGPDALVGATAVVMIARDNRGVCHWAGDSRLYRLRSGTLEQLTTDHDLLTEMEAKGAGEELIASVSHRNAITRAVGAGDELALETIEFEILAGDKFLLCSDGLYREVSELMIASFLAENDPVRAASVMVQAALEAGGRDNVSVIVIKAADGQ